MESSFARWTRELTHAEIARALKALTRDYVQRRSRLRGEALTGKGKQAAFALYYGPRHFVITREVLAALDAPTPATIIDLGCGTGVAGAAWALRGGGSVVGVDLDANVLAQAVHTWRETGVRGGGVRAHIAKYRWPKPPVGIVAAFTINELDEADREKLWRELERQVQGGSRLLVLEPLATRIAPWWQDWAGRVAALGGRADEWHFDNELPERVHLLGKSAGLRPERLGAKSLWA
ncbi:MAG: methyltransferase domain-containing protein [Planctomycetes bacterium]|nr:methyltransferase domain-containing protein [Planctomycetota bacterium]MCW8137139.1 methyltransferase domain-containing protein [Planctomycetota bacterium]